MTLGRKWRAFAVPLATGVLALAACSHASTRPEDAGGEAALDGGVEPATSVATGPVGTLALPAGGGTTIVTLPPGLVSGGQPAPGAAGQAAGSSTTSTGVPSDPDGPFCRAVKESSLHSMDVTDPAVAPVLRKLLAVAPEAISEQLRFLVDVNVRLERLDPDDTKEVDALSELYTSGQIDRAANALGLFVVDTCGIDLGL